MKRETNLSPPLPRGRDIISSLPAGFDADDVQAIADLSAMEKQKNKPKKKDKEFIWYVILEKYELLPPEGRYVIEMDRWKRTVIWIHAFTRAWARDQGPARRLEGRRHLSRHQNSHFTQIHRTRLRRGIYDGR